MKYLFLLLITCMSSVFAMEERTREKPADWLALHWAAQKGTVDDIKKALAEGADLNETFLTFGTALHIAVGLGKTDIVDFLLSKGMDIDTSDGYDITALEHAAQHSAAGELVMVKHLVSKGAKNHLKALLTAACYRHIDVCKFFLDREIEGIDHNFLACACQGGYLKMVKLALPYANGVNNIGTTPSQTALNEATIRGHVPVVTFLLENGAEVDLNPLFSGRNGREDDHTLQKGTALKWAADSGYDGTERILCLLLKRQADPCTTYSEYRSVVHGEYHRIRTVLEAAALKGDSEKCTLLLLAKLFHNSEQASKRILCALHTLALHNEGPQLPFEVVLTILMSIDGLSGDVLAMEAGECSSLNELKERFLVSRPTQLLRHMTPEMIQRVIGNYTTDSAAELWLVSTHGDRKRFNKVSIPILNGQVDFAEGRDPELSEDDKNAFMKERLCKKHWKQFIAEEFAVTKPDEKDEQAGEKVT